MKLRPILLFAVLITMVTGNIFLGEIFPFSEFTMFAELKNFDSFEFVVSQEGKPIAMTKLNESTDNLRKIFKISTKKLETKTKRKNGGLFDYIMYKLSWERVVKNFHQRKSEEVLQMFRLLSSTVNADEKEAGQFVLTKILKESGSTLSPNITELRLMRRLIYLNEKKIVRSDYEIARINIR